MAIEHSRAQRPDLRIVTVEDRRALKAFVRLPESLYRGDPHWVPPLWHDEMRGYDRGHNPILRNSEFVLHLALRGGLPVGRNLVYVDHAFNEFNGSQTGFFGAFESEENGETSAALIDAAEKWLDSRGMEAVRGPIHPTAEIWGFLLRGFDRPPIMMSPYNPPWYNEHFERAGYFKVQDLLVYEADAARNYVMPDRFSRFAQTLLARHPYLRVRPLNRAHIRSEADNMWRISNAAYVGNWGYVPVDRHIVEDLVRRLKPIIDPDAVWFVEDTRRTEGEQAVGYALGFPDINPTLRRISGRLLPFGLPLLLAGARKERNFRLFALGVIPEYQGLGLDVLLYIVLFRALAPRNIRLEANYILEDNYRIRNALEKLGLEHIKTYRVYEKTLI
ncbi:hypothetical protein [Salinispira pacifica]